MTSEQPSSSKRTTRSIRSLLLTSVALALSLGACGSGAVAPTVDCSTAVVPSYQQLTMLSTCTSCHSSALKGAARGGAPNGVDYDTYDGARAHAASGAAQVNGGSMPPGNRPRPSDAESAGFYAWALCGTPQ